MNVILESYYKVLSDETPDFLTDYLKIKELRRINSIGMNCGTDYTKLFNNLFFYSRFNHSLAVALIIWHFTHDKVQTIAGLLHDIATPSFSHCIDFLHKDYLNQESTEFETYDILDSSDELKLLLARDHIPIDEVRDYKKYPIADNPTPQLSADRLEYTLSGGITFSQVWNVNDILEIYSDIGVFNNEFGEIELGFRSRAIAEKFVLGASKMWHIFVSNKEKLVMQFIADVIKQLVNMGIITENELYSLSEREIISLIYQSRSQQLVAAFEGFQNAHCISEGNVKPDNSMYIVNVSPKKRFINPLINGRRGTEVSSIIHTTVERFLNYTSPQFCWFNHYIPRSLFETNCSL